MRKRGVTDNLWTVELCSGHPLNTVADTVSDTSRLWWKNTHRQFVCLVFNLAFNDYIEMPIQYRRFNCNSLIKVPWSFWFKEIIRWTHRYHFCLRVQSDGSLRSFLERLLTRRSAMTGSLCDQLAYRNYLQLPSNSTQRRPNAIHEFIWLWVTREKRA
jgi:hypothetical protein